MKKLYYRLQTVIDERVPLSAFVRWIIIVGISFRVFLGRIEYSNSLALIWVVSLSLFAAYSLLITLIAFQQYKYPDIAIKNNWYFSQILVDSVAFTIFYVLTGRVESDFYLFYFLPLLIGAERFRGEYVILIFTFVSILFFSSIVVLHALNFSVNTIMTSVVNNGLPKWFFFFVVILIAFVRGDILKEKKEELEAVYETAVRISENKSIDARLEAILEAAVQLLNAKGCKLYLYSPRDNTLHLVGLKGLSSSLFKKGYTINVTDGVAGMVFQTQQPIIENNYKKSSYRIPELENLFESVIEVPLFLHEPLGVMGVFDTSHRTFTNRDVNTLQRLAQYAVVAVNDAQLVDQAQKQSNVLKSLYAASNSMIDKVFDIEDTLNSIVEHAWKLSVVFNTTEPVLTYFALFDNQKQSLGFRATYPKSQLDDLRNRIGEVYINEPPFGIMGRAIATGHNQNVSDVRLDADYLTYSDSTRSQLVVLAKGKRGIVGVISIEHPELNAFPLELQEQMEVLATQAASATENANLFELIQNQRYQAEELRKIAVKISSYFDINQVGQQILESLRSLIPFDRATLQLIVDNDVHYREIIAKYNLSDEDVDRGLLKPVSEDSLVYKIIKSKNILVVPSTKEEPSWDPFSTTRDIQSWVGVPLIYGDKVIGLITLDNIEQRIYTNDNKNLIDLFSSHAAGVFQNAILHRQLAEHVEELTQTKDHLETLLNYYNDYQNLALIGLVYGESIHYANNHLGMAKTIMKNIQIGDYDNVNTVSKSAEKAVKYINDYLGVLKDIQQKALLAPSLDSVDIQALLSNVVESKRKSPEIVIKKIFNSNKPFVRAPEHQLRQVFYVIIQNAIDSMPGGVGTIEIRTETKRTNFVDYLLVSISDTGLGIEDAQQQNLFKTKPISINERKHKGSGMGLAWARSFIRSYGGDIYFRTKQGYGTTIYVRMPYEFGSPIIPQEKS